MKTISSASLLAFLASALWACSSTPEPVNAVHSSVEPITTSNSEIIAPRNVELNISPQVDEESGEIEDNPQVATHETASFTHHQCFVPDEVFTEPMIPSSIQFVRMEHGFALAGNELDDSAVIWRLDDGELRRIPVAEHAQVSCLEPYMGGVRLAMIQRDNAQGAFVMNVQVFDEQLVHNSSEDWKAATRGFVPDPGTMCGFLERREMLVVGTRPHGDKAPYHGLFRIQSRALELLNDTSEHVPELLSVKNGASTQVLVREVRRNSDDKPVWPHVVYELSGQNAKQVLEGDFIVADQEQWHVFNKNGCMIVDGKTANCPETQVELSEIRMLPGFCDGLCMHWRSKAQSWIVEIQPGQTPRLIEIPFNLRILPIQSFDNAWYGYELDEQVPDKTSGIRKIKVDRECLLKP